MRPLAKRRKENPAATAGTGNGLSFVRNSVYQTFFENYVQLMGVDEVTRIYSESKKWRRLSDKEAQSLEKAKQFALKKHEQELKQFKIPDAKIEKELQTKLRVKLRKITEGKTTVTGLLGAEERPVSMKQSKVSATAGSSRSSLAGKSLVHVCLRERIYICLCL